MVRGIILTSSFEYHSNVIPMHKISMESLKNAILSSHSNFEAAMSITNHGEVTLNKILKKNDEKSSFTEEATYVEEVKSETKGKQILGHS